MCSSVLYFEADYFWAELLILCVYSSFDVFSSLRARGLVSLYVLGGSSRTCLLLTIFACERLSLALFLRTEEGQSRFSTT